jgi:hypothetical protein
VYAQNGTTSRLMLCGPNLAHTQRRFKTYAGPAAMPTASTLAIQPGQPRMPLKRTSRPWVTTTETTETPANRATRVTRGGGVATATAAGTAGV